MSSGSGNRGGYEVSREAKFSDEGGAWGKSATTLRREGERLGADQIVGLLEEKQPGQRLTNYIDVYLSFSMRRAALLSPYREAVLLLERIHEGTPLPPHKLRVVQAWRRAVHALQQLNREDMQHAVDVARWREADPAKRQKRGPKRPPELIAAQLEWESAYAEFVGRSEGRSTCPECGKTFTPSRKDQVYDRRVCAAMAGQRRRRAAKAALDEIL
jgi:hypothetical protein